MANTSTPSPQVANGQWTEDPSVGRSSPAPPDGSLAWAGRAAEELPALMPAAFPVVRTRWERLVTRATIPAPVDRTWKALVAPNEIRMWLARCHGALEQVGADAVLDFEDGE